jgi:hypothetical protein
MDYQLPCTCGEYLTVTEGSAGAQVKCVCGRIMTVPSLGGLRELAGEPAHQPAPEIVVEQMLLAGALPPNRNCVHCGLATANVVNIQVECERVWVHKSGGYGAAAFFALFISWWFAGIALLFRDKEVHEFGRDKIYALPLPVCPECRPMLNGGKAAKASLARVPEYRLLLEKFPEAKIDVLTK